MAPLAKRKALIIAGVVTLCAIIGAVVGIVIWKTTTSSSDDASNSSGTTTDASSKKTSGSSTSEDRSAGSNSSSADGSGSGESKITSDPTKATFSLSAYAIGDWGTTTTRDSCCKRRTDHDPTNVDKNAEEAVGVLMGIAAAAAKPKPKVVIGHGDNFYWTGINDKTDQTYRFTNTFEGKFKDAALMDIPWVNVMGNHDYGGASYLCEGTTACADATAIVAGLKNKFSLQADYKSPNNDRWIMEDHFYVHSIKDDASGVSIDIFNMDTNDADSHGAQQICCQCYGYAAGDDSKCSNVVRGDKYCAGGSTDMYDACMKQLSAWGDDSRKQLAEKVKASKATWKIVNSHYSPYNHYAADRQDMWKELLDGLGVQIWMNGHTHGEKHDHASFGVHFIENGAGGGILNEAASGIPPYVTYLEKVWTYANHDYGFFELSASEEWMKVRFLTFDDKWSIADDFKASTLGGVADHHCWYIPVDGSLGKSCDTTK